MFLTELNLNQQAVIKCINASKIPSKLFEMGCYNGNSISLLDKAPFDGPLYVLIGDSYLLLRMDTAKLIEVDILK